MVESKTVLVTGGAGFIGSHLSRFLLEQSHKVYCLDNLASGRKKNIVHLKDRENFIFLSHDIVQPLDLKEKIDEIYNLAAIASPVHYQKKPVETLLAGSVGVKNMLDFALKNKARFLQASTSEVYGNPKEHPQKESYYGNVNPIGLRSCYDESKRFAESLIMAYHRTLGLDTRIARIFNTYGPAMQEDDGRIVPMAITQALKGKQLTVFGDGKQTRSFCFVNDLVEGLAKLMQSDYHLPVNLGNPNEITVLELAEKVIGLTGSKSEIVLQPLPEDDPLKRKPDISLAKEVLGWQPKVSLEEGLKQTIDYFRKELK